MKLLYASDICLIESSSHKMFSNDSGYEFTNYGFKKGINDTSPKLIYKTYSNSSGDVGLVQTTRKAIADGCKILFGFATSKECLLVGKIAVSNDVLIASNTCAHSSIEKFYPHIITGVPSAKTYSDLLVKYILNKQLNTVLIYSKTDLLSREYLKDIKQKSQITAMQYNDEADKKKILDVMKSYQGKEINLAIMFYPVAGKQIVDYLASQKLDFSRIHLLAAPSWPYDLRSVKKIINLDKFKSVQTVDIKYNLKSFKEAKDLLKISPQKDMHNIHLSGYQISSLVMNCYLKHGAKLTEKLKQCLFNSSHSGPIYDLSYNDSVFPKVKLHVSDLKERIQLEN